MCAPKSLILYLYILQLWVSVLNPIYCKKKLESPSFITNKEVALLQYQLLQPSPHSPLIKPNSKCIYHDFLSNIMNYFSYLVTNVSVMACFKSPFIANKKCPNYVKDGFLFEKPTTAFTILFLLEMCILIPDKSFVMYLCVNLGPLSLTTGSYPKEENYRGEYREVFL